MAYKSKRILEAIGGARFALCKVHIDHRAGRAQIAKIRVNCQALLMDAPMAAQAIATEDGTDR